MFDFEIARYLYRVAFLYEKVHGSTYKARAYFKAALAIDGYSKNIEELNCYGKLRTLPSIGVSIEKNIIEIIETKHLLLIDELLGELPYSLFDLYEYANIKDKLLKKLINHEVFDFIQIFDIISKKADYLSLSEIDILKNAYKNYRYRHFQYAQVFEFANELIQTLKNFDGVVKISLSDELYLHHESLAHGNIICTHKIDLNLFIEKIKLISLFQIISIDKNVIILERFGILFNLKILTESEFKIKISELKKEKRKQEFPKNNKKVVSRFYGDLHLHTDWSDGLHSIEQMRDTAVKMGYSYIAITDHSQSLKPMGMSELDTLTQIKKIREINEKSSIPILTGIEVDILADGSLDLSDNILKEFDIVIAAIHSHFNQPPLLLSDRISKALSNKYVNVLAHPMGRLLGRPGKSTVQREELPIRFESLLKLCREYDVALEINCFPERFDLSIKDTIRAVAEGVKISVGTDSHSVYHMACIKYALDALKFACIPEEVVLNCYSFDKLRRYLNIKHNPNKKDTANLFEEKFKDFKHYFSKNDGIITGAIKAVGIDLTGSENKASGFAVLSGFTVDTMRICSDDEMIECISKIKPDIVSIDSPLSIPVGRCCGDKNCECAKYGIMRYCELTLRHFGIGVYPCLIDSMVNLTLRGMKLAVRLRNLGFNVIESYPGVAQDLLHIPRKRKGLELLLNGMKNFGIIGIQKEVTHDEADAITSALVGYFYLDNKYVGMGNNKEDYLIVPKLKTDISEKGIVIGLVGHIAAGKTTVTEYLRFKYGFISMRFSKLIEERYNVSGREELQRIGYEIAENPLKQKELSDIMLDKIEENENYVIDGIRQIIDFENLSSKLGNRFILLYIESSFVSRAKRYCKIYHDKSLDDFKKIDTHPVEESIARIVNRNNFKVINNKGFKELMSIIDSILSKLNK